MRVALGLLVLAFCATSALAAPPTVAVYSGTYEGQTPTSACSEPVRLLFERTPVQERLIVQVVDAGPTYGCAQFVPLRKEFAPSDCERQGNDLDCTRYVGDGIVGTFQHLRIMGLSGATYEESSWDHEDYAWALVVTQGGTGA